MGHNVGCRCAEIGRLHCALTTAAAAAATVSEYIIISADVRRITPARRSFTTERNTSRSQLNCEALPNDLSQSAVPPVYRTYRFQFCCFDKCLFNVKLEKQSTNSTISQHPRCTYTRHFNAVEQYTTKCIDFKCVRNRLRAGLHTMQTNQQISRIKKN